MKESNLRLLITIFAIIVMFIVGYETDWVIFIVYGGIVLLLLLTVILLVRRKKKEVFT